MLSIGMEGMVRLKRDITGCKRFPDVYSPSIMEEGDACVVMRADKDDSEVVTSAGCSK
jgi:hypothetical protein